MGGYIYPEFPTGNGQIDLIITYGGQSYGIEVRSYTNQVGYKKAIKQAVGYAKSLNLREVTLALFIEAINEENRRKLEVVYIDQASGVTVKPIFVEIGLD